MAKAVASGKSAAGDGWERRAYATRGLSELIPGLTRAAYKKKSPAGALLLTDWAGIVGPRLAMQTEPRRLSGTTLTLACSGPMAMELQHAAGSLIERINAHAGRIVVEQLRFVQAPVSAPGVKVRRRVVSAERVEGVADGPLNDALGRLRATIRSNVGNPKS